MNLDIDKLIEWFNKNKRNLPWRNTHDPYAIWISEIMLQQTRIDTVIFYYERFLKNIPTIKDLATVEDEKLLKLWEGLGYYSRAKNLKKSAIIIMNQFQGIFPSQYEDIIELKGVGDYSAGAILSRSFNLAYASVDGNVLRVLTRLNEDSSDISLNQTKKNFKLELEKFHPNDFGVFNESLMELGEVICTPKNAKCEICPLQHQCKGFQHNTLYHFPVKTKKTLNKTLHYTCIFIKDSHSSFYFEIKESGVLKDLFSPVIKENHLSFEDIKELFDSNSIKYKEIQSLKDQKHVFSHQTWIMKGYQVLLSNSMKNNKNFYSIQQIKDQISIPICFQKFFNDLKIM